MSVVSLSVDKVKPKNNDRKRFAEGPLVELAGSIAEYGLAQPIIVRPKVKGSHALVAGERRWRAHQIYTEKVKAGEWAESPHVKLGYVDAIVRDYSDEQASGVMLAENMKRVDLDPIEEAHAYWSRMEEFGWSKEKCAETANVSENRVERRLMLLKLAPELQQMVSKGILKTPYAEEISVLDYDRQRLIVKWILKQSYIPSRKHIADYVAKLKAADAQQVMFSDFFTVNVVQAAEQDDKRVSDMLRPLPHLPALPTTRGNAGTVIDAYLALLIEEGFEQEAAVVMDLWRKLMKINRCQIKPWDSKVLPLLDNTEE